MANARNAKNRLYNHNYSKNQTSCMSPCSSPFSRKILNHKPTSLFHKSLKCQIKHHCQEMCWALKINIYIHTGIQ